MSYGYSQDLKVCKELFVEFVANIKKINMIIKYGVMLKILNTLGNKKTEGTENL